MNINAAGTLGGMSAISSPVSVVSSSSSSASSASAIGPATVSKISKQGDFLSKLHDLQSSDPAKFQAKMKEMSDHLRAEAQEKGGAAAAKLNAQADKVDAAAKSGDLSGLQPPGAGKGAHRGHHAHSEGGAPPAPAAGAASDTSGASSSGNSDPADTNGDGKVSAAELAAYDVSHAAVA